MAQTLLGRIGYVYRGTYDPAYEYHRLDVVYDESVTYQCIEDCIGKKPKNNPDNWAIMSESATHVDMVAAQEAAQAAQGSAQAAAGSASAANASKQAAAGAATAAGSSAGAAQTAKQGAETARDAAQGSAQAAEGSATAAADSAQAAQEAAASVNGPALQSQLDNHKHDGTAGNGVMINYANLTGSPPCPYDIGDILETKNSTSPATRWPGTVWAAMGAGKMLVGIDPNDPDFDTVGKTGGEKAHALTPAEGAVHDHGGKLATVSTSQNMSGSLWDGTYFMMTKTAGALSRRLGLPYQARVADNRITTYNPTKSCIAGNARHRGGHMYYVITVKDGVITGRHHSTMPITADTFATSSVFAGHTVQGIDPRTEYTAGFMLAEYTAEGALRPLVDRINDGLAKVPDGFELIDGELVQTQVPEAEAPPTLMARVVAAEERAQAAEARAKQAEEEALVGRAAGEIYAQELAKAGAPDSTIIKLRKLYPVYMDFVERGEEIPADTVLRHNGKLYKVPIKIMPDAQRTPDKVATGYVLINDPETGEWLPWEKGSWAEGAQVFTPDGRRWRSNIDSNTREPGTFDSNWTEVVEQVEVKPVPDYPPVDPEIKNANKTIRWAEWEEQVMTNCYMADDGVTYKGVRKVSTIDYNTEEPSEAKAWRDATPEDY